MTNNSSDKDKECEEGSSNEKEAAPPPKKKRKVKKLKIKITNWNSVLEETLQKKTVHGMCLYKKLILTLLKDLHRLILNHSLGGKLMQHAILL